MTIKSYEAEVDIKAGTIVMFATEGKVAPATSAVAMFVGVNVLDVKAGGQACVEHNDIVKVTYGGTVLAGASLTSDEEGRAIGALEGDNIIGYALGAQSLNDIALMVIDRTMVV